MKQYINEGVSIETTKVCGDIYSAIRIKTQDVWTIESKLRIRPDDSPSELVENGAFRDWMLTV